MKNEQLVYIAPCQEVEVELPFMVKQIVRVRKASRELCKQCLWDPKYSMAKSEDDVCVFDEFDY